MANTTIGIHSGLSTHHHDHDATTPISASLSAMNNIASKPQNPIPPLVLLVSFMSFILLFSTMFSIYRNLHAFLPRRLSSASIFVARSHSFIMYGQMSIPTLTLRTLACSSSLNAHLSWTWPQMLITNPLGLRKQNASDTVEGKCWTMQSNLPTLRKRTLPTVLQRLLSSWLPSSKMTFAFSCFSASRADIWSSRTPVPRSRPRWMKSPTWMIVSVLSLARWFACLISTSVMRLADLKLRLQTLRISSSFRCQSEVKKSILFPR